MKQTNLKSCIAFLIMLTLAVQVGAVQVAADTANASRRAPSKQVALNQKAYADYMDGITALHDKNFILAEDNFREALSNGPDGSVYFGLALALSAQGKTVEAMQIYQKIFHSDAHLSFGGSYFTRAHLEYALLLNQTGHWAEAIANYQSALSDIESSDIPKPTVQFDSFSVQPEALAAATHIALGIDATFECNNLGEYEYDRAFNEYKEALKLEPSWGIANYYYGVGWQKLAPAERIKFGNAQQAKTALQKAVKIGTADVKKAAERALKDAG